MSTRRWNVGVAVVALLVSLAALVAEIAAWRELRRQRAQAIAARLTVDYLVEAEAMYGPRSLPLAPARAESPPLIPDAPRARPDRSAVRYSLPPQEPRQGRTR
jgi:hypothetical protein